MGKFNFRHVLQQTGIASTNQNNWAIGNMLRDMAAKRGISPEHVLTEKTDPNPTVGAPHMICHYPMSMFDDACERAERMLNTDGKQGTLF